MHASARLRPIGRLAMILRIPARIRVLAVPRGIAPDELISAAVLPHLAPLILLKWQVIRLPIR